VPADPRPTRRAAQVALQVYRLAILVAIAWIIHAHHLRLRLGGLVPVTVEEVRTIYPTASTVAEDAGIRAGWFVKDDAGHPLGYVLRTSPFSDKVIGYRGWTDTLVAFDPALHVIGVRIRSSHDTREHVGDVKGDPYFMKTWNGKSWDEVARTTPAQAGIEGVSGASMTSLAIAEGIMRRLRAADSALAQKPQATQFRLHDAGLVAIIAAGMVLAFTGTYGRKWLRRGFQILVIVYVGFLSGDLLAQSLIVGWMQSGAPWRSAPGLVLLLAAALAVPWATRKPLYCQQLCPHGAAQELLSHIAPRRWRISLPADLARGLRWLPGLLLAFVVTISVLVLPIDLAHIEPFDAYVLQSAGVATIAIAIIGLVASLFVPMAYCHYGCPTGALLEFIRGHGRADRFGMRDIAALLLLAIASVLSWKYHTLHAWMVAD
jgi:NosR/NirI family transcriptional regulator, nitrous oxide reductase regulator